MLCVGRARHLRRRMSPGIVPWNRCLEHNYTREIVRLMTTLPVPSNRNTLSHSCTERHAQLFLPPAATISVEGGDACAPEYPGTASCKSAGVCSSAGQQMDDVTNRIIGALQVLFI